MTREEIEQQIKEFSRRGGKTQVIESGVSGETIKPTARQRNLGKSLSNKKRGKPIQIKRG